MSAVNPAAESADQEELVERVGHSLRVAGVLLIVIGVGMALMPFVGPLVGARLDGAEAWEITWARVALHVVPGLVGIYIGLALLGTKPEPMGRGVGVPGWGKTAALCGLFLGVWNGAGPWLMDSVLPSSAGSKMFLSIPDFDDMSTSHQLTLEAICHLLPGLATVLVATAAFMLLSRLPVLGSESQGGAGHSPSRAQTG